MVDPRRRRAVGRYSTAVVQPVLSPVVGRGASRSQDAGSPSLRTLQVERAGRGCVRRAGGACGRGDRLRHCLRRCLGGLPPSRHIGDRQASRHGLEVPKPVGHDCNALSAMSTQPCGRHRKTRRHSNTRAVEYGPMSDQCHRHHVSPPRPRPACAYDTQ